MVINTETVYMRLPISIICKLNAATQLEGSATRGEFVAKYIEIAADMVIQRHATSPTYKDIVEKIHETVSKN
jgi:hypothetical protein